jgi:hypothetical protein
MTHPPIFDRTLQAVPMIDVTPVDEPRRPYQREP